MSGKDKVDDKPNVGLLFVICFVVFLICSLFRSSRSEIALIVGAACIGVSLLFFCYYMGVGKSWLLRA